jgi:hypothetical protein
MRLRPGGSPAGDASALRAERSAARLGLAPPTAREINLRPATRSSQNALDHLRPRWQRNAEIAGNNLTVLGLHPCAYDYIWPRT